MRYQQYLTYKAVDFSIDPSFLAWQWFRTEESDLFWKEFLLRYPEKSEEIKFAIEIVKAVMQDDSSYTKEEKEKDVIRLTRKVQQYKRRRKIAIYSLSAVVVMVTLIFIPFRKSELFPLIEENTLVEANDKDVQLILGTGDKTSFKNDVQVTNDSEGNIIVKNEAGETIEKHDRNRSNGKMNRLIVPRGKRSSLMLADGSHIWVNSGSVVEFPSTFAGLDKREIKVEGEIYIEVKKDTQNPFIVTTPSFEVTVHGTKFNVSAYSEDIIHHVTVAEGLVSIISGKENEKNYVAKNQQLLIDNTSTSLTEVDVHNYISWKDGILRFESEPLCNILTRLSRYYDVHLEYGKEVETIRCSGKLYLFDDWRMVFDNITKVSPVDYSLKDGKVQFKCI